MCEIVCFVVIQIPHLVGIDRYVIATELLLVYPWLGDITVVGYSAIFGVLHMVGIDIGMHIIALAQVIAIQNSSELAGLLAGIVTSGIVVVQEEAYTGNLIDVCGKIAPNPVFSVLLVATRVVCKVCDRTLCVGEKEV